MPNTERITFTETDGLITVKSGTTVLAESRQAVLLSESGYRPRHYFPRTDVNMSALVASETKTDCPFKGEATYFSAATPLGTLDDIAWSYTDPIADAIEIKDHIAFYEEKLKVEAKTAA